MICNNKYAGLISAAIGIFIACSVANKSHAETFEGINVSTQGKGEAIVFIPGLNSASSVFNETCDAVKANHTCHLLQLPGFAGAPAVNSDDDFLVSMRDRIEHYVQQKKLKQVTLVGHSLGGTLSLMIAQHSPALVKKVVIIDALPFYSAIQNPAATAESMKPMADQMRNGMNSQSDADFFKNAGASLNGMSNNPARLPQLTEWMKTSNRKTTTDAIYSMMITDLRGSIANIKAPTLVLGSWAAYKPFGATKESTTAIFTTQYAALKNVDIRLSETGYHFLMWDDAAWVNQQINQFIQ